MALAPYRYVTSTFTSTVLITYLKLPVFTLIPCVYVKPREIFVDFDTLSGRKENMDTHADGISNISISTRAGSEPLNLPEVCFRPVSFIQQVGNYSSVAAN